MVIMFTITATQTNVMVVVVVVTIIIMKIIMSFIFSQASAYTFVCGLHDVINDVGQARQGLVTRLVSVTHCILFCSTPELGALAPFVYEVCGPFYTCGVWPWH